MGRIEDSFARAKAQGRGAFIAYLTMGFPSEERSVEAAGDLISQGADIIELGVPFSDPFADGATIRAAAYEALRRGTSLAGVLRMAARLRAAHPDTGLVLFSYANPLYSMGLDAFARAAADAGIDAALAVDVPLEERGELLAALRPHGIGYIPLVAPDTPPARIAASVEGLENSFAYAITVKGITGERATLPPDLARRLDAIRAASRLPVAAGFGISTKAQAEEVCRHADGFIAGSALVKCLAEGRRPCLR